jgi:hypothetical protein
VKNVYFYCTIKTRFQLSPQASKRLHEVQKFLLSRHDFSGYLFSSSCLVSAYYSSVPRPLHLQFCNCTQHQNDISWLALQHFSLLHVQQMMSTVLRWSYHTLGMQIVFKASVYIILATNMIYTLKCDIVTANYFQCKGLWSCGPFLNSVANVHVLISGHGQLW